MRNYNAESLHAFSCLVLSHRSFVPLHEVDFGYLKPNPRSKIFLYLAEIGGVIMLGHAFHAP